MYKQGGEDPQDALSCRSFSAKEPLIIGLFCGKRPLQRRHPMGLRHPTLTCEKKHFRRVSECCIYDVSRVSEWCVYDWVYMVPSGHPNARMHMAGEGCQNVVYNIYDVSRVSEWYVHDRVYTEHFGHPTPANLRKPIPSGCHIIWCTIVLHTI